MDHSMAEAAPMNAISSDNTTERLKISQQDNFAANFGEVLRSSAIFWAKNDPQVKTTISISNYWAYKNAVAVMVLVNLRDTAGKLIRREKVSFETSDVVNYHPPAAFDGSVEVEAFSAKNLRIPYAAVMAIYECADSISMVHSYSRAYSQHEIEDKRTICIGEESCWTLQESAEVTSFCVFHNGPGQMGPQRVRLGIRRYDGEEKSLEINLPTLRPFQSVMIEPRQHFPEIASWLAGLPGNGRLSFKLEGGFTRFLCGIRAIDWSQLQVTHSNFNYSVHETDQITSGNAIGYMRTPAIRDHDVTQEIVIYPDMSPGDYTMRGADFELRFRPTEIVRKQYDRNSRACVQFYRDDGTLPSRIVTGFRLRRSAGTIPAECSYGVAHHKRPAKHFAWMVVSREFNSTVCWVDFPEIYGGCPADAKLVFKFYSAEKKEPVIREAAFSELPSTGTIRLEEIFDVRWPDEFGYLTIWCSYGGLEFFSTLQKKDSISIEHSF
jgi:hypothetical protein